MYDEAVNPLNPRKDTLLYGNFVFDLRGCLLRVSHNQTCLYFGHAGGCEPESLSCSLRKPRILLRTWGCIVRGSSSWPCEVLCREPSTHWHRVTSNKTWILSDTAVITWNLTTWSTVLWLLDSPAFQITGFFYYLFKELSIVSRRALQCTLLNVVILMTVWISQ